VVKLGGRREESWPELNPYWAGQVCSVLPEIKNFF